MKRIIIFTNIPSPYRTDWFWYLQQNTREYDIFIVYASRNEDNRSWEIEEKKLKNSYFLNSYTFKIPYRYDAKYIHFSNGVEKILKKLVPDIIIGAEYNSTALQALRYCRLQKIPYISWTDGTLYSERNINELQKWIRKFIIRHSSAFLASSTKAKEAQIAYGAEPQKCFVSFLTVDIEKYKVRPEKREKNRILCVGSLIERKGIDLLFSAVQEISEDYTLVLAGSGPERERLWKLSKELGIDQYVKFLGNLSQEELKKEYAKSGIFVLPTREDCFGLVILEAMCAKLPVVCSKYADGVYDLIEDGKNGYILDPYQTKEFGKCLQGLLREPERAAKMGQASEKKLESFQYAKVSEGFWKVISYVRG